MRGGRGWEGVPIGGEVHILNFSQYDRRLFKRGTLRGSAYSKIYSTGKLLWQFKQTCGGWASI